MIRFFLFVGSLLFLSLTFVNCVSPKKVEEYLMVKEERIQVISDSLRQSSTKNQRLDSLLTAARGGNELLLIAQQQLQDRLLQLDDEIERLKGNLNNTQQNLQGRLSRLNQQKATLEQQLAGLRQEYGSITRDYENQLNTVSEQIASDSVLSTVGQLRSRAGSVSLVINAEELFQGSSTYKTSQIINELLAPLARIMEANPLLELSIIGHSDNQLGNRSNGGIRGFSAARAVSLANYLSDKFYLSAKRIAATGMGEAEPLQSNATAEGRRANRRIEFRFTNSVVNLLRALEKAGQTEDK